MLFETITNRTRGSVKTSRQETGVLHRFNYAEYPTRQP